jgi:hypothetical protein
MREDRQMAIEVNHLILPTLKGQFRGDGGSADRKYRQLQLRHGSELLRVHVLGQVEKLAHSHRSSARFLGSAIFHKRSGTRYEIRSPEAAFVGEHVPPGGQIFQLPPARLPVEADHSPAGAASVVSLK